MSSRALRPSRPLVILASAFILVWILCAAFPFIWTIWGSFKLEADFFSYGGWKDALLGPHTLAFSGHSYTFQNYRDLWIDQQFWRPAINSVIVTVTVTVISLTFGTLGGYALARSTSRYAFWILIAALIFRAMPGLSLISGYLFPFFKLNLWGRLPTAAIVLVALNQPFTLWLLHSFFLTVPRDLDEAALVDGCSRFQAFRLAIMPVMWPGVVTTGIFSFLVGYSDYVVCTLLLPESNQTMVPATAAFLGSEQHAGKLMFAVAATVSMIVPLLILILAFQRRIVDGLTAGAVKG
ncbi:carbohydrate ABC transporter permease [Mesorhizobium sp. INR15]|uniref:carbohydrate ABC transporter permease n=1 Tax=Mesorhizobium sp. INR15 TaxID=2654248 RepID=UPI001896870B|nr:carbohydrate ABC transporter permease [Mesorhizobium sp. INR15]QPC95517.1 ABC transporter permease subunit [Mesorhizobium sp. INR15]